MPKTCKQVVKKIVGSSDLVLHFLPALTFSAPKFVRAFTLGRGFPGGTACCCLLRSFAFFTFYPFSSPGDYLNKISFRFTFHLSLFPQILSPTGYLRFLWCLRCSQVGGECGVGGCLSFVFFFVSLSVFTSRRKCDTGVPFVP